MFHGAPRVPREIPSRAALAQCGGQGGGHGGERMSWLRGVTVALGRRENGPRSWGAPPTILVETRLDRDAARSAGARSRLRQRPTPLLRSGRNGRRRATRGATISGARPSSGGGASGTTFEQGDQRKAAFVQPADWGTHQLGLVDRDGRKIHKMFQIQRSRPPISSTRTRPLAALDVEQALEQTSAHRAPFVEGTACVQVVWLRGSEREPSRRGRTLRRGPPNFREGRRTGGGERPEAIT